MTTPVDATERPGAGRSLQFLERTAPHWGGANVLLVLDHRTVDDIDYVKVLLKRMPAASAGWVPTGALALSRTRRSVVVDLSARTIVVRDRGKAILRERVVVGAPSTPTPTGQFAVDAPVDQPRGSDLGAAGARARRLLANAGALPGRRPTGRVPRLREARRATRHGGLARLQATVLRLARLLERGTPVLIRR